MKRTKWAADWSSMADWSSIPPELVGLIANNLTAIEDYSALASVCRSYRSATKGEVWRPQQLSQPPCLLLCSRDEDGGGTQRGLLSMYRHMKKFEMDLPELHGGHCWGSPYGWIVTLGMDMKLHLFNPFNRRRIPLPNHPDQRLVDFYEGYDNKRYREYDRIDRALLFRRSLLSSSWSDSDDNFLVVTIGRYGKVRFLRGKTWEAVKVRFLRGETWVSVNSSFQSKIRNVFCYRGQIYAVGDRGQLFICSNIDGPGHPTVDEFIPPNMERFKSNYSQKYYLVEVSEELLMVFRQIDVLALSYYTDLFKVYKLNFETKQWIEIDDLGDNALFIGDCQSISLPQPGNFNCRSNCIYFTDDEYFHDTRKRGEDMGIYDFKEHTSEPFYEGDDSLSSYSAPTWFIPTLT